LLGCFFRFFFFFFFWYIIFFFSFFLTLQFRNASDQNRKREGQGNKQTWSGEMGGERGEKKNVSPLFRAAHRQVWVGVQWPLVPVLVLHFANWFLGTDGLQTPLPSQRCLV